MEIKLKWIIFHFGLLHSFLMVCISQQQKPVVVMKIGHFKGQESWYGELVFCGSFVPMCRTLDFWLTGFSSSSLWEIEMRINWKLYHSTMYTRLFFSALHGGKFWLFFWGGLFLKFLLLNCTVIFLRFHLNCQLHSGTEILILYMTLLILIRIKNK